MKTVANRDPTMIEIKACHQLSPRAIKDDPVKYVLVCLGRRSCHGLQDSPDIHVGHDPEIVERPKSPCPPPFFDRLDVVVDPSICLHVALFRYFEPFQGSFDSAHDVVDSNDVPLRCVFSKRSILRRVLSNYCSLPRSAVQW